MTDRRDVTRSPSLALGVLFAGLLAVGLLAPSGVAAEDMFLKAAKFRIEYTPQNSNGSLREVVRFGWDCAANPNL